MKAVFIIVCLLVLYTVWGCANAAVTHDGTDATTASVPVRLLAVKAPAGLMQVRQAAQSERTAEAATQIETREQEVRVAEIGVFKVTAYCPCKLCNGKWAGQPAKNGEEMEEGTTIAVDPAVIPLGSYVYIEGVGARKAQDTGSAIKDNTIDLFLGTHGETEEWGVRYLRVYWVK